MDHLRPGHAHRSSSDRLLSNYLESQKMFTTSLLALLSQSHSSTSSLLAYVTSSPGVLLSVRRAVRHSAFEGPLSPSMLENPEAHIGMEHEPTTPGWTGYIRSLDDFRRDLKQIHLLEEEMTRVKRDKEILVGRLIKQTKTRPTKSDLKDMAKHLNPEQLREYEMSSRASSISLSSEVSGMTATQGGKETRRASKLKEAQAELLGCEEHLRALEVRIENERNNVMYRGLEERFRAMELVSQMWLAQARSGLEDLEKLTGVGGGVGGAAQLNGNANAFELDSNGSLAPSQSASQVGYEDSAQSHSGQMQQHTISPRRQMASQRQINTMLGPGSITSVQEEKEDGSSEEEDPANLVMHENVRRPVSQRANNQTPTPGAQRTSPPLPMKDFNPPGGRKAMSELGQPSRYNHVHQQPPLRRAMSNEQYGGRQRGPPSETSSTRTVTKKRGFFASIARFFKGPSKRDHHHHRHRRPGSPPTSSTWGKNVRPQPQYGRRIRSDSSSDEDDMSNLVSVSNRMSRSAAGGGGGFNVADIGKVPAHPKRSQSAASGKSRSTAAGMSTPRARPASVAGKMHSPAAPATTTGMSRSGTVRSLPASGGMTRSGTVRSLPAANKRASTATARSRSSAAGPSIMSIVDQPPPAMPDVPKAPQANYTGMEIVKAPGSSLAPGLVLPSQTMQQPRHSVHRVEDDELGPNDSISRANSQKKKPAGTRKPTRAKSVERRKSLSDKKDGDKLTAEKLEAKRSISPLPPSKLRSPPLKSAMRPTSPTNYSLPSTGPPPEITTLYDVHAPGPVQLPPQEEPVSTYAPTATSGGGSLKRPGSAADDASVYESAKEEDGGATPRPPPMDDSSDDESVDASAFKIVDNTRLNEPEEVGGVAHGMNIAPAPDHEENTPSVLDDGSGLLRRKSVRLEVPTPGETYAAEAAREQEAQRQRELEKERARMYLDAAANASDESLPQRRSGGNWETRIGRMHEDTSDDDDNDPRYVKARRSLMSHQGDFKAADKKKKRMSVKSTGSQKSSGSRSGKGPLARSDSEGRKLWRP